MKALTLITYLITFLVLESCIEYSEKMKLNNDGSGELTFAIGINKEIFSLSEARNEFKNFNEDSLKKQFKDGIEFIGSRTYMKDNNRWVEVKLKFDSMQKLQTLAKDSTQNGMIGFISLTKDKKGNWIYTRKIFPNKFDTNQGNDRNLGLLTLIFSQYKWTYELILPSKVISTNAHEVNNDSNTLKWVFSLSSLTSEKQMFAAFEYKREIKLIHIFVAGIVLVLFIVLNLIFSKIDRA